MIGYKLRPDESDALRQVWRPTDDLDDAAMPPDLFVLATDVLGAIKALEAINPAPEGTRRVDYCYESSAVDDNWPVLVYAAPILACEHISALTSRYRDATTTVAVVNELVATLGEILVPGYATSYIGSSAALAKSGAMAVPIDPNDPNRGCKLVPATNARLASRAARRRGVEAKSRKAAAEAARYAAENRRHQEEWEARLARLAPALTAVVAFNEAFNNSFAAACRRRKVGNLAGFPYSDETVNLYAIVVAKSHRELPAFGRMIAAIHALPPADRREILGRRCGAFALDEYRRMRATGKVPKTRRTREGKTPKVREVALAES